MKTFQKPLTKKEEEEYLRLLTQGNAEQAKEAKKQLIEHNLRLVAHIVKKYQNVLEETEDLISIGSIGLIKAIDTFDGSRGRLATYACRCIDNELLMMLRGKKKTNLDVSLYEPIGKDREGNEIRLMDVIENQQPDIVEEMEKQRNIRQLRQMLEQALNKRELEIISLRYGLSGHKEMTQNEIGNRLGISRSYVSRIEKKAIDKLRIKFNK